MAFLDPPFNIGHGYKNYKDKLSRKEYLDFLQESIVAAWGALSDTGILCLHGPDDLCKIYLVFMEYGLNVENIAWINWHYRFGQNQPNRANWLDSRCHLLIYAKDPQNYTWNPEAVLVPSDRASKYHDKRIGDYANGGLRLPMTIWGLPSDGPYWGRVTKQNKERYGERPNQLPERYLERLLRAYTNRGDLVLDGFCGTGTTLAVAQALGRNCIGIDVDPAACKISKQRVMKGATRVKKENC